MFGYSKVDIKTEVVGNALYRVEGDRRLYQIPSKLVDGKLVENCNIYKAENGVEILQTDDITFVLN